MNIAIAIPSPENVSPKFAFESLFSLVGYTKSQLPDINLSLFYQTGVRTDKNRNLIIDKVLKAGTFDYILWLDADMNYPQDMLVKYIESNVDIVGCLYFKRSYPHNPVGYVKGDNPIKPFKQIDPNALPENTIVTVDGLGFGGVLVKTGVYTAMGEDKWMCYGKNYHLPYETEGQLTHDLEWCRKAQEYGYTIHLHTGVKPTHLAEYEVGQKDFVLQEKKLPSVVVIMPTIHPEMAQKTAKILSTRAGYPHKMLVVEDIERTGFVATCNSVVNGTIADYYVFLTDDIFPSRNWLKDSMELATRTKAGLVGYNDGKWNGGIATCGLVERNWMLKNYNGNMFHPGYFGHYNDTEITMLAMNDNVYAYDPSISLVEVDYEKETKKVHTQDRELFKQRKLSKFDGRVTNDKIMHNYA